MIITNEGKGKRIAVMSNKRNQHFVPQFYLKQFADNNNKFYVYDFEKGAFLSNPVPYKSQCHKPFFYGKDGIWENRLGDMEAKWGASLKRVVTENCLEDSDIDPLREFIIYQRQRTNAKLLQTVENREALLIEGAKLMYQKRGWIFDESALELCKQRASENVTPAENIELVLRISAFTKDLCLLIVHYKTNNKLITSDSPVITLNAFSKFMGFGYDNIGVVYMIPLTPEYLLIVYDGDLYTKYKRNTLIESSSETEVSTINMYMLINAEKLVFSKDIGDISISEEIEQNRIKEFKRNKTQYLGPPNQRLIINQEPGTNYYYELPYLYLSREYRRIPECCREAIPRHYEDGWERKLLLKYEVFSKVKDVQKDKDLLLPKKDLKLGCRRMYTVAKKYWQNKDGEM